jgi:hypothetical protein
MEFNMLENALSSLAIPWLMALPKEMESRVVDFKALKAVLKNEYNFHWNKNVHLHADYTIFRRLWAVHFCSQAEIQAYNSELKARFVEEGKVAYTAGDKGEQIARNMRQVLLEEARSVDGNHKELALEIFAYVEKMEREVFSWSTRGLEIFKLLTNRETSHQNAFERFHKHAHLEPPSSLSRGKPNTSPDLVVILEYDVHFTTGSCPDLDYFGTGECCNFPAAMNAEGYHALFFASPRAGNRSGIGVFAKSSVFDLAKSDSQTSGARAGDEATTRVENSNGTVNIAVVTDTINAFGARISNFDMHERWHLRGTSHRGEVHSGGGRESTGPAEAMEMPRNDRKGVAICGLELKQQNTVAASIFASSNAGGSSSSGGGSGSGGGGGGGGGANIDWVFDDLNGKWYNPSSPRSAARSGTGTWSGDEGLAAAAAVAAVAGSDGGGAQTVETSTVQGGGTTTSTRICLIAMHLMTSSRDNPGKVFYPGEVRSGEIETVKRLTEEHSQAEDALLMTGDFNINMQDIAKATDMLSGRVALHRNASHDSSGGAAEAGAGVAAECMMFCTGFVVAGEDGVHDVVETGAAAAGSGGGKQQGGEADSACDRNRFEWGAAGGSEQGGEEGLGSREEGLGSRGRPRHVLYDAYEGVNRQKVDDQGHAMGTSHTPIRVETIDHCWYDACSLELLGRSPLLVGREVMPNRANPSDHIPVVIRLGVVTK